MRTFEELKTIYNGKKVNDIESEAKTNQGKSKKFYVQFLESLFYLERSGRYTENPKYKKSRFEQYISFEYGIHHQTYMDHRQAYQVYPDITFRHSPNLFALAKKKCGAKNVPVVFKEVKEKEQSLKRPIRKEEIQAIIINHAKPVRPPVPKPDVIQLQDKVKQTKEALKAVEKVVLTKDEQITKLKATVKRLQEENDRLRKENEELTAMLAPIVDRFSGRTEAPCVVAH